jgi:HK97 family phage major capsid protein
LSSSIPARIAAAQESVDRNLRAGEFLQIARALICSRSDGEAERILAKAPVRESVRQALTERAAVPAGVTYDTTWAGSLVSYQQASEGFSESLRNVSAFDRVLSDGAFLRVPPVTAVSVTTAGATAYTVNEAAPKGASQLSFTSVQLQMSKIVSFIYLSQELMRAGGVGPIRLLQRELSAAVAVQSDSFFLSQLLSGLTAVPSSGGTSAVAVRTDLRYLMDAVSFGANARLFYIAPPTICKRLSVIGDDVGGKAFEGTLPIGASLLDGLPLLCTDAATAGTLTLLDASQVAVSVGIIELDRSDAALLQVDTAPDSPPTASTPYVSLWPENKSALRATRYLSVQRLRTTAAASVSGITGIGDSPS